MEPVGHIHEHALSVCFCNVFILWYVDTDGPPIDVCRCGHPSGEHIDIIGPCAGEAIICPASRV